ncbi:MAG: PAS domain-containing protein [Chroococcidiopsidaceae cyanobacterium CP_BM_RX_35]|nr:PAS domain-containing protein [Chroococcidiopsidaceae cyanobacterium CP_BM_RX_35]
MRAEKHEGMAENLFGGDGEISALLRSHDWSQTPLGAVETWSESLRTAVQIRLTELDQAQTSEKAQRELALPPQDCTQTAALHQAVEETAERTWAVVELARAEAALRESGKKVDATFESEEQSRNILESITDAFFAVDQNWRFTYVNQTAYTLVNRTPGDLIGKIFWEEFPGVKDSKFEQMHRRVMRDRIAESLTEFYPDHDRWYEVRTYPAANGVTMYFRNVTEQIQAEAALRESAARFRRLFESKIIGMGI